MRPKQNLSFSKKEQQKMEPKKAFVEIFYKQKVVLKKLAKRLFLDLKAKVENY